MRKESLYKVLLLIFLLAGCLISLRLAPANEKVHTLENRRDMPVGEIAGANTIRQFFTCSTDNFDGIGLIFATYARENQGTVRIRLSNVTTEQMITDVAVDAAKVQDNQLFRLSFPRQVHSQAQQYLLQITSDNAQPGNAVTAWATREGSRNGSELFVGSVRQSGNLAMQLYFQEKNYSVVYFFVALLLFAGLFLSKKHLGDWFAPLLVLLLAILFSVGNPVYSIVDEGAHFDYINHIIQSRQLPVLSDEINYAQLQQIPGAATAPGLQHEAVQPPLYYALMALSVFWLQDMYIRLLAVRVMGGLLLALSAAIAMKCLHHAVERKYPDNTIWEGLVLILYANPGIVTRCTTVSNEPLLIFIVTLFLYTIHKLWDKQKLSGRDIASISFLAGISILTKFSSLFLVGIIVLLVWKKEEGFTRRFWQQSIGSLLIIAVLLLPWIGYNLHVYHSITGVDQHLNIVRPTLNPAGQSLDIPYIFTHIGNMAITFWLPQEMAFQLKPWMIVAANSISLLILLYMALGIVEWLFAVAQGTKRDSMKDLEVFSVLFITLNILSLVVASMKSGVDMLLGRYLYMSSLGLLFLLTGLISRFNPSRYHPYLTKANVLLLVAMILFSIHQGWQ